MSNSFEFTGSINLNDLKTKIEKEKQQADRGKYKNIFWKPSQPETTVRILPYKHGKSPFNELYFHYGIGPDKQTILCPKHTFGKADCPICEHVSNLYAQNTEESKLIAKGLRAKIRYYVPIINKSEIEKGVEARPYFWGMAPSVYESILKYILEEEDYGDIANPKEGNDIKVEYTEKSASLPFGKINILVRPKKTPILKDMDLAMKIYNDVPNIYDLFKESTPDEIQAALDSHLGTESPTNSDILKDDTVVSSEIGNEKMSLDARIAEAMKEE